MLGVGVVNHVVLAQFAQPPSGLAAHQVAGARLAAPDLALPGDPETLGGGAIGLHLRHGVLFSLETRPADPCSTGRKQA